MWNWWFCCRHVGDAEHLYASAGQRDSSSNLGTEKPYSGKYAYDYREAIDQSKSEEAETSWF